MIIRQEKTCSIVSLTEQMLKKSIHEIFTKDEINSFFNGQHYQRLAVRFLAKQIIIGHTGRGGAFQEISILNNEFGCPIVSVSNNIFEKGNSASIHLSLSHSKNFATAFVIFEYFFL